MSASSTRPLSAVPRISSITAGVTLNRSAKKRSGFVSASSVIDHGLLRWEGPILARARLSTQLFREDEPGYPYCTGGSSARRVRLDDLVHAAESRHQRSPRREDVGAVQLVDLTVLHGGDRVPSRPRRDRVDVDRLATPRGHDDRGGAPHVVVLRLH